MFVCLCRRNVKLAPPRAAAAAPHLHILPTLLLRRPTYPNLSLRHPCTNRATVAPAEKLVRVLFELARYHAPSTIFMDELDALMMARGGEGEHEASRRMKTELLIQMDGLAKGDELVFVLAATNMPWELDMAMLRRLEKRIMVPLPNAIARKSMLQTLLSGRVAPDVSFDQMAEATEGFSGSDVTVVAKEAAMRPLRRLMAKLSAADAAINGGGGSGRSGGAAGGSAQAPPVPLQLEPITPADVDAALRATKPSARLHEDKYVKFTTEYGTLAQ